MALVKAHRMHGHLAARLDPLGSEPLGDPALDETRLIPRNLACPTRYWAIAQPRASKSAARPDRGYVASSPVRTTRMSPKAFCTSVITAEVLPLPPTLIWHVKVAGL